MPTLANKPLAWFKVNPQVRKQFDEADLRRLGESLRVKQLQPVLCQPDGTIIAGERRYRAAKLVGLPSLEAKIADEQLADDEILLWQLVENMLRDDLKPIEQVEGIEAVLRLNPGWDNKDIAERLRIDPSMVTRLRSVSRCIPAVREALAAGNIGISVVYAISKCETPQEQEHMLAQAVSGASRDAIEQAGRKSRSGKAAAVKVSRLKVPLPGGATVQVSGAGISLDDAIEATSEALKAMKKAREDGLDSRTAQAVFKDKAKKRG